MTPKQLKSLGQEVRVATQRADQSRAEYVKALEEVGQLLLQGQEAFGASKSRNGKNRARLDIWASFRAWAIEHTGWDWARCMKVMSDAKDPTQKERRQYKAKVLRQLGDRAACVLSPEILPSWRSEAPWRSSMFSEDRVNFAIDVLVALTSEEYREALLKAAKARSKPKAPKVKMGGRYIPEDQAA